MMKVERFRLGNGLRVVFYRDENTEMVHLNLLYGVGAKNESEEYTGLAHLLEHLMFEGTDKFPSFKDVETGELYSSIYARILIKKR